MGLNKSEEWILETLYDADKTDVETYRIYQTMRRYIYDTRDFTGVIEIIKRPHILRFKPVTDVADDCFFSVSLFHKLIRKRKKTHGAPGVSFYSNAGINAFNKSGYTCVSKNWDFWIDYVRDHFNLFDK